MHNLSKHRFLIPLLALGLLLLAACSPAPQAQLDAVSELATLADANGDIEATLEIGALGSSGGGVAANNLGDTATHEVGHVIYKGKALKGLITEVNFPSLWAKGSQFKVRGRVQNVRGVAVFVGVAQASSATQVDIAGAILMSANSTLPAPLVQGQQVRSQVALTYEKITWTLLQPRPEYEEIAFIKSASGVVGVGKPTQPTGLPKGQPTTSGSLTCNTVIDPTIIGPVGTSNCKWEMSEFDAAKGIIAILIGL